ncbi:Glycosyltransferase 14 [Gracilaria domingensis]|nr:Glycosyltransferase 14 [Gracilaria domingensis]
MRSSFFEPSLNRPGSAFTLQACEKRYDAAWSLVHPSKSRQKIKDSVQIAYFVQVGNDSVALLERLFARIHSPRNVYIVHIDAKVDPELRNGFAQLVKSSDRYKENVHLMESEMVTYKAVTMVLNTIAAMTLALEKHKSWDYFINLSGADYPLVSVEKQARLLARTNLPIGRLNFVTFFPKKEWGPYSFRIRNLYWDPGIARNGSRKAHLFYVKGHKENPLEPHRSFVFTKAEAWVVLSRPFVKFLIRSSFAKRMLVYHMHVLSVPEHYFMNVLYNHPIWRQTIVQDAFRKVVWYHRGRRSGQHPYVLDKGNSNSFWDDLYSTRSLFARKFSVPNSSLMDRIDTELSGISMNASQAGFQKHAKKRRDFYNSIVQHFDHVVEDTLLQQMEYWPLSFKEESTL